MIKKEQILKNYSGSSPIFPLPNFVMFPSTGNEFTLEYPAVSTHWLNLDGSGQIQPGTTQFANSSNILLTTAKGQFNFQKGGVSSVGGLSYNSDGNPNIDNSSSRFENND